MTQQEVDKASMKLIWEGKDLLFTFQEECVQFAYRNNLTLEYVEADFIDEAHYNVKGYKSKLYWI